MLLPCWFWLMTLGTVVGAQPTDLPGQGPSANNAAQRADLAKDLQKDDRVLFIGDELTQQMFYTRAVSAALLAIRPDAELRFFNGGRDGQTAQGAAQTADELLTLCHPTVVFICFGLNDGKQDANPDAFKKNLLELITELTEHSTVRQTVLVGPPPVARQSTEPIGASSDNRTLRHLSESAKQAAHERGVPFIALFDHMEQVYIAAAHTGHPLTHDGRLPTEAGHIIIASIILKGIGVTAEQLDQAGWCPLPPRQMGRIRQALAASLKPPDFDIAQQSRDLYLSIQRFDEAFFKLWRLSGRSPNRHPKEAQLAAMDQAWQMVQVMAQQYHR